MVEHGVTILGPTNLPSEAPFHASQMYAKNIVTFLLNLVKEKQVQINLEDEIIRDTLISRDGQVVNERIQNYCNEGFDEEGEPRVITQPLRGKCGARDSPPRVAAARQPWAVLRYPFGINQRRKE